MNASRRSVLAVHPGALGDVVLFGRLLRAMGDEATLIAGGEKARLLAGLGVVRKVLDFDALPMHEVFSSQPPEQCRLSSLLGRCERLVSCFATGDPLAQERLAALAGAGMADFLPVRPPAAFDGHLLEFWARQLGIDRSAAADAWPVPHLWREEALRSLRDAQVAPTARYCVIHPGAGGLKKCWPLERFLDLADRLTPRRLGRPVLVLGPAEQERWPQAARDIGRRFPLVQSPPLSTLAGLLAGAAVYVGNDSGVSHLSAAVGTATVALFEPPGDRHFAPIGPRLRVVRAACLADIAVEGVLKAIVEIG